MCILCEDCIHHEKIELDSSIFCLQYKEKRRNLDAEFCNYYCETSIINLPEELNQFNKEL